MCCCNRISNELDRAFDTNDLECCIQNKPDCNCCTCPKPTEKGKFGLAYVVETPRRKYTKPTGWEVEFEDTPSNISYNCNKMTQWANRPPIAECLEKETHICCKSYEIRKLTTNDDKKPCCCTPQSVAKKPPCCCPEPRKCCCPEPPKCGCCREPPKRGCCPAPPKCSCCPEPLKCSCCPEPPKCCCCPEPPKCCCFSESPKCGCSQKMCASYYTKLPDCQKCNCIKKCLCQLEEEELNCSCKAARQSMKESSRKQKRCKCKSEKRSSPDRGDYSFSKSRPKSGHRKKKVKQYAIQEDRDDSLDYIPRKETIRDNWRSNETGRNLTEREKTFIKERGEDKKSNYTLTENFDRTQNTRGYSPQFQNEKSYKDETARTEKSYRDNTGNYPFENTNPNSTRMDSHAKTFTVENRNNTTVPLHSIREDTFMSSPQKDNTFSSRGDEFSTSTPRQSIEASRNATIKEEPHTTVIKEKLFSEPIPLPWKDTTQEETVNENKFDHRRDPTPLLLKIRRAHHKQIEDIEIAREAELHSVSLP